MVVTMAEVRLHGDACIGGLFPRNLTVRMLCGLRGNQLLTFKSVRFQMDNNGEARYTFEQRQTLQMSEQSIASGGMKLVLLVPTAAAVDQVVASCEVNTTNSMLPVWLPIFSSAGQNKSCCGQLSVSIDARGLPEDFLDDSETEGSLTPCLSVASNANLMRLTATGCKDDTPMPTPTAKLEQGTPLAEAESEVPVAAEKLFALPLPLPSGARPTLSYSWSLLLATGVIAAIAAAMSASVLFPQARTSSFSSSRPPIVKMMNQTATPSTSTSTKIEPPAAPPVAEFVKSPPNRRPNTLVVSAPHGQLVQIIDGQDGYCLHWRRGIFGGHARFAKCSDRRYAPRFPHADSLLPSAMPPLVPHLLMFILYPLLNLFSTPLAPSSPLLQLVESDPWSVWLAESGAQREMLTTQALW